MPDTGASRSGTSTACAAMFGAVAYLAVRQYRFERMTVRTVREHAEDVYGAVQKMAEGQLAWTEATVREIEKAWNPPPHRPTEVKYEQQVQPADFHSKNAQPRKGWW